MQYICCTTLIARLMGPTWGPSGADRIQVGSILAPWTLQSANILVNKTEDPWSFSSQYNKYWTQWPRIDIQGTHPISFIVCRHEKNLTFLLSIDICECMSPASVRIVQLRNDDITVLPPTNDRVYIYIYICMYHFPMYYPCGLTVYA